MKKAELLEYLKPFLADYTMHTTGSDNPLKERLKKNTYGRGYGVDLYDIRKDKHVASAFKPFKTDSVQQREYLRTVSKTVISTLCQYALLTPSHEQLDELIKLTIYDPKELNQLINDLSYEEKSCFGSYKKLPLGVLLYRALWDHLCEDSKVLSPEQKKRRRNEKNARTGGSLYQDNFRLIVRYLLEASLLDLFMLGSLQPDQIPAFMDLGCGDEAVTELRQRGIRPYERALAKVAVIECKSCILNHEIMELQGSWAAECERAELEFARQMKKLARENDSTQLKGQRGSGPVNLPSFHEIGQDLMNAPMLPSNMGRLAEEFEEKQDEMRQYYNEVQSKIKSEFAASIEQRAVFLKETDYIDVGESTFIALLAGDSLYNTMIGHNFFELLAQAGCDPTATLVMHELEDEDEWDYFADPGENGKQESVLLTDTDIVFFNPPEAVGIRMPLKVGTIIASYAGCHIDLPFSIRKSHIKMFKSLGVSDRKARDYAVIAAALRAAHRVNAEDNREIQYFPDDEAPAKSIPVALGADEVIKAAQNERDEAIRQKKAAEKESQLLRHEMAKLKRALEQTSSELERSNLLLELHDHMDQEEPSDDAQDRSDVSFPYNTDLKVVLYGGFHSFHQDLQSLIPSIRIMPSASHLDLNLVRNADIVFIQINRTSHSNYWNVRDTASATGVPYHHLNYAGPRRCAEEIVRVLKSMETGSTEPDPE